MLRLVLVLVLMLSLVLRLVLRLVQLMLLVVVIWYRVKSGRVVWSGCHRRQDHVS